MENGKNYASSKIESIENITVASSVLEKLLSLSDRRIRQLTEENTLVRATKGKYDLVKSVTNYIQYLRVSNDINNNESAGKLDYDDEHAKNERAKRMQNELKLGLMKGELHKASQVELVMTDMLNAFRNKMLGMPAKVAPLFVDRQDVGYIKGIMTREITEALNEIKDYDPLGFYDEDYINYNGGDDDEPESEKE